MLLLYLVLICPDLGRFENVFMGRCVSSGVAACRRCYSISSHELAPSLAMIHGFLSMLVLLSLSCSSRAVIDVGPVVGKLSG